MSKSTLPRLKALRDEMGKAGITAFIIPGRTEAFMYFKANTMPAIGRHELGFPDSTDRLELRSSQPIKPDYGPTRGTSSKPLNNWKIPGSNFLKKDCPTLPPSSNGY